MLYYICLLSQSALPTLNEKKLLVNSHLHVSQFCNFEYIQIDRHHLLDCTITRMFKFDSHCSKNDKYSGHLSPWHFGDYKKKINVYQDVGIGMNMKSCACSSPAWHPMSHVGQKSTKFHFC